MIRLILEAIDAWRMWRLERRLCRLYPEFTKRLADLKEARRRHKPTREILADLKRMRLSMMRGEI
ncbi:MAG: hypothetical protein QHC90_13395 [Shinella sp.]|nr:hypothetical protein [Shinella sp.]